MTEDEIIKICDFYAIENYIINPDMTVDVNGDVELAQHELTQLPLIFGKVTGNFNCFGNRLSDLEGCPKYVGSNFNCAWNQLTTFQHLPINFYIGGRFYSQFCGIQDLFEYSRLFFGYIGNKIYSSIKYANTFLNENKNPSKKDLPRLLSELRKIESKNTTKIEDLHKLKIGGNFKS